MELVDKVFIKEVRRLLTTETIFKEGKSRDVLDESWSATLKSYMYGIEYTIPLPCSLQKIEGKYAEIYCEIKLGEGFPEYDFKMKVENEIINIPIKRKKLLSLTNF